MHTLDTALRALYQRVKQVYSTGAKSFAKAHRDKVEVQGLVYGNNKRRCPHPNPTLCMSRGNCAKLQSGVV